MKEFQLSFYSDIEVGILFWINQCFFFRLGLELMNQPKSYSNRNRTTAVFHLIEKLFLRNFHDKKFQRYLVPIVWCPDHLMKIIGNDNEFSLEKVEYVIKTRSKTSYVHSNYIYSFQLFWKTYFDQIKISTKTNSASKATLMLW